MAIKQFPDKLEWINEYSIEKDGEKYHSKGSIDDYLDGARLDLLIEKLKEKQEIELMHPKKTRLTREDILTIEATNPLKFFIIKWVEDFEGYPAHSRTFDIYTYIDDGVAHEHTDFDVYGGPVATRHVASTNNVLCHQGNWVVSGYFEIHQSLLGNLIELFEQISTDPDGVNADRVIINYDDENEYMTQLLGSYKASASGTWY